MRRRGLLPPGQEICVVLDAVPSVRVTASREGLSRQTHDLEAQRVTITKVGQQFVWAARERRTLVRNSSGAYDYFIDPQGGGWLKVEVLPAFLSEEVGGYEFFEMVSLGLATTTYWGVSPMYDPDCAP